MKKIFLICLITQFSCRVLHPIDYGHDFIGWFHTKNFENSFSFIPKTVIDNLLVKSPSTSAIYAYSNRRYPSFDDYVIEEDSFYMFQYEVTNRGYQQFLNFLKANDTTNYQKMFPDEEVWSSKFGFNIPLNNIYFRHPNYDYYPVVGVTHEQAVEYCKWITEQYRRNKNRKYKNVVFKLPTKTQWFVAAIGKNHQRNLPWDGVSMQNEKGEWLANFYKIEQIQISRNDNYLNCHNRSKYFENCLDVAPSIEFDVFHGITMPVTSHYPNDYGLYNMSGNVEEYVREPGITKGGSWNDPGYYLQLDSEENYDSLNLSSSETGFRMVMEFTN